MKTEIKTQPETVFQQNDLKNIENSNLRFNKFCAIPKRFHNKTLKTYIGNKEIIRTAYNAAISGETVYLHGKVGSGKTHIAVGLIKEYVKKFIPDKYSDYPLFISAIDILLELRSAFNKNNSEDEIAQKFAKIKLLCIDDLGAEKTSDWTRQTFYKIINARYNDMLPTIVTSNLSPAEVAVQLDERIASRFYEMGEVLHLIQPDYRLTMRNKNNAKVQK